MADSSMILSLAVMVTVSTCISLGLYKLVSFIENRERKVKMGCTGTKMVPAKVLAVVLLAILMIWLENN